ncbi:MAG: hypothetical protein IT582_07080, partial [Opitutaceae bacterium]|nr:hypothetical protein [Opitutaceae bacterium]
WQKSGGQLHYTLQTPVPLTLRLPESLGGREVAVAREFTAAWPAALVA